MAQRSTIVFLTPGQLAGQMHTPRIHCKEHMPTEKTRFQYQIWPQKRGQFPDLQVVPLPIEGWFWGPLIGLRNGPRNAAFFSSFLPYHLGLNIWSAWRQLQRSLCARLASAPKYYLRSHISLRNHNHMRSTQLLRLQAYTHSEGPQPRSQKCLFLRPQKRACWQFFYALITVCYQHSPYDCRHPHIERVHGCMAWFLAKRNLLFWTCCVQCRRNTARHTRQHHLGTVSGPWLCIWQWNSNSGSWR